MRTILFTILAVIAGLTLAFVLVISVELFSFVVHPFPEDFDGSQAAMCEHVANYPDWVLALVVPMWAFTVFASVWVVQKIGNVLAAVVVGALLLVAVGCNQWMLPYPIWFEAANIVAFPLATVGAIGCAWPKNVASGVDTANC